MLKDYFKCVTKYGSWIQYFFFIFHSYNFQLQDIKHEFTLTLQNWYSLIHRLKKIILLTKKERNKLINFLSILLSIRIIIKKMLKEERNN